VFVLNKAILPGLVFAEKGQVLAHRGELLKCVPLGQLLSLITNI
jgi:hypothetical protein